MIGAPAVSHRGPAVLWVVLLLIGLAVARTVDVPGTGYGIKSDEATYVAMALSLAYDGNLSYERRDFERFTAIYHRGPEGIFLKRGRTIDRIRMAGSFPFVHLEGTADPVATRVYFGKSAAYALIAAPFVRFAGGVNGMLILHVLLLAGVGLCGYWFLAAQSPPAAAATFTAAFLGAAALPVYGVFLMPEIFNFSLVFIAYFLWAHKFVRPSPAPSSAGGRLAWTGLAAAVLLGLATYSKPLPNVFLIGPLVVEAWWHRQWLKGVTLGAVAAVVTMMCFVGTAAVSGEFNYQGGFDRRTFHSDGRPPEFPFDAPESTWDRFPPGDVATDGRAAWDVLVDPNAPHWFGHNLAYFFLGRHFGLIPYYFPAVILLAAWAFSSARRDTWRVLIVGAFLAASVTLLLLLPFTWSGGGGPPGNRYLVSAYPVLFFLAPPFRTALPGVLAWMGGVLFTAKMLVTPFETAKFTWLVTERGPFRRLPIELTMPNDLPVMLDPSRGRVQYGHDPFLLLYFLDQHAWPPEPDGMWVSGAGRADIIVRATDPIDHLAVEARSPIRTVLTVSLGAESVSAPISPGHTASFNVPAGPGVRGRNGYAYVMRAESSEGFVPQVASPRTDGLPPDFRNLGAQMHFRPVSR